MKRNGGMMPSRKPAENRDIDNEVSSVSVAQTSQTLTIRAAVASDATLLKTLIHEFAEFERLKASITEGALLRDGFGAQPRFRALIAEWGKQPAGYALFFDCYSTFNWGRGIFMEDIYVREKFRGKRIGLALFARLAEIARDEDCAGIMFNVLDWNNAAIDFYCRLGATFMGGWKVLCLEGNALLALSSHANQEPRS